MQHPHGGRRRLWLPVLLLALGIAGCGPEPAAAPPAPSAPPELPPPAEPAVAPQPAVAPAGRVIPVGAAPEGAVADPTSGLVAVGVRDPDQLALVDGASGTIATRVPLPGHLRHLQLGAAGGPVLVPDENSNSLLTVDLPSGAVRGQVLTGVSPHDATAAADGIVFVANEGGGNVAAVRDGAVLRIFPEHTQPGGVAAAGPVAGTIDVRRNDLTVYDTAALREIGRAPAGAGPTHLIPDRRGRMLVADTRGDALLVFDLSPQPRQIGRIDLPGAPYGLAYDANRDRAYVTLTGRNEVVAIDSSGAQPRVTAIYPTVAQPNTVAVNSATGRVFVTGTKDGVLQLIDP